MAKMTILEGNSNDKDNIRAFMVKGEAGVSPTVETSSAGGVSTITITDAEGTHEIELNDGVSPTVDVSKEDGVTTVVIHDVDGDHTATIADGVDLEGGVPTNAVIGWDSENTIPDGYEEYTGIENTIVFNNIANLKVSTELVAGNTVRTLGYYTINDGGCATYNIRTKTNEDTTDDRMLIALSDNTLVAELIIENNTINAKVIGAKGDGTTDDSTALQYLFSQNAYNIEIPNGNYFITTSVNIYNFINKTIEFNNSNILYSGTDYAFVLCKVRNSNINFGRIDAESGGCIKFVCTADAEYVQYINIHFIELLANANYNCIYALKTGGWINEVRMYGGRLSRGLYGIVLETNDGTDIMDGWKFYDVGIEGVSNGVWLNAVNSSIYGISFFDLRYAEFTSYTYLLKTTGNVNRINFYGTSTFFAYKQSFSSDTNNLNIYAPTTVGENLYNEAVVMNGKIIPNEKRFPIINGGIDLINENDDLNNYVVPSTYTSPSNAITQSLLNKPSAITTNAFKLLVISLNEGYITANSGYRYGIQIILWQNGRMFMRGYEGTSFTSWKEVTSA